MSYISAEMLQSLGVDVTGGDGGRNIQARCPVHHLVTGRPDNHPSWYMAVETGAWICFSCKQRGSLYTLLDLMDVDREVLGELPVRMLEDRAARLAEEEIKEAEPERVYISRYAFRKNPHPPLKLLDLRDIAFDSCVTHDVRFDTSKRCLLIPIYAFTGELLGWQEKASGGYFLNVPDEVKKSHSLFGYDQLHDRAIVVESPLDVCRLTSYGLDGGVATFGSEVSNLQVEAIANQARRAILAFDEDYAGHQATESVSRRLTDMGVEVLYFRYPRKHEGKDPGELSYKSLITGLANARHFTGLRALRT